MPPNRPATIEAYIAAAPADGQPHLRQLHAILAEIAPDAQQVIKWNTPFFIEPRFLFAFSAHKAHLGFTTTPADLEPFADALKPYAVTKMGILKIRYDQPLPEPLIRKIARHRLKKVSKRMDDSFW